MVWWWWWLYIGNYYTTFFLFYKNFFSYFALQRLSVLHFVCVCMPNFPIFFSFHLLYWFQFVMQLHIFFFFTNAMMMMMMTLDIYGGDPNVVNWIYTFFFLFRLLAGLAGLLFIFACVCGYSQSNFCLCVFFMFFDFYSHCVSPHSPNHHPSFIVVCVCVC